MPEPRHAADPPKDSTATVRVTVGWSSPEIVWGLMSWLDALPVALLCVAWMFLPGLLITYGAGLRSLAAWALAPVVTVAIVATTAVVAQKLGVDWSLPLVIGVVLVLAVLTVVVSFLLRRRAPSQQPDSRRVLRGALLGLVPALLLGIATLVRGFGSPDSISQTYDAVFHYNAVALILDTHNASSLNLAALNSPGVPSGFYPAAWHDMVSLIVMTSGCSIPLATNMLAGVVAVVVWVVSCLLLVRQIIGRSAAGMAITGLLSVAFTAFPWDLLGFGVLLPNLLGLSIAPAVLALVISVTGLAKEDAIGKGRAWVALPVAAVGTGFAHPNVLFSLIALSIFPVATVIARRARAVHRAGNTRRAVVEVVVWVVVFLAAWWWSAHAAFLASVRAMYWPPLDTPAKAVGEVLLNATTNYAAPWILALVVLLGIWLSKRYAELRWVVAGFVITGVLYVIAAALNRPDTAKFTGYWYNDPHRLAAMLPITAIPLAVVAIMYLARRVHEALTARRWTMSDEEALAAEPPVNRSMALMRTRTFGVATVAITLVLTVLTAGLYAGKHAAAFSAQHIIPPPAQQTFYRPLDQTAQNFFEKVKKDIPPDSIVADNPWNGSALLWALADRRVLFPHMSLPTTDDQEYLAYNMKYANVNPQVCTVARRLHVDYLIVGDARIWPWDQHAQQYPGFADPGSSPAFKLVDSAGDAKLYKLIACDEKS